MVPITAFFPRKIDGSVTRRLTALEADHKRFLDMLANLTALTETQKKQNAELRERIYVLECRTWWSMLLDWLWRRRGE